MIIFPPIFLSFFFSFFSCCNISGLSEKIWALNVKCSTSFSLSRTSTRLARFARFNVKMFVQKSFCGARSDTWADLYYCITMLHKDITTWHSQYDAVRHLSDDFKLHTQYNYMRKPSYTLLSQEGIFFAVISRRNLLMKRQKLFFRMNFILFFKQFIIYPLRDR